jgi:Histidine kinase-, DNA gyrase B-, and HSP90-like ATPase
VIRAALGEVEDYQRVTVRGVEPATIVGAAAADLAHLLAELVENALVFSPPDQTVDIRGRGRNDGYTLAVIDSGLGMPPADIEAANRRLAGAESFTIAPSKYLGHYVAGNLAARHRIGVRLDASPGNGITATVNIPPELLTTEAVAGFPAMAPDDGRELPPAGIPAASERVAALEGAVVGGTAAAPGDQEGAGEPWGNGGYRAAVTSSWPAPVGLSTGAPAPESTPSRTQSGLVKRATANGTAPADAGPGRGGPEGSPAVPTGRPSGDLLAALSRHSANLQGVPGMVQPSYPPPSARGPQPVPPGPAAPPLPPTRRPGSGVYDPTAWHDRVPGDNVGRRPPAREEPPARGPGLGGEPPPQRMRSAEAGPGAPTGSAPAAGFESGPPLARRVRGAQMPTTNPMSVRRTTGEHAAAPGGPAAAPRDPTQPPPQNRSADDVYSFLTSFTAGVQRGLDDTRPRSPSGEDNGSG